MRLIRARRLVKRWQGLSGDKTLGVIGIVFIWLLLSHWIGCGWFVLGWCVRERLRVLRLESAYWRYGGGCHQARVPMRRGPSGSEC